MQNMTIADHATTTQLPPCAGHSPADDARDIAAAMWGLLIIDSALHIDTRESTR